MGEGAVRAAGGESDQLQAEQLAAGSYLLILPPSPL